MKKLIAKDVVEDFQRSDFKQLYENHNIDITEVATSVLPIVRYPDWLVASFSRRSYLDLYDLIWGEYKDDNIILVTGSLGIGKSVFALYILYMALKNGIIVGFSLILLILIICITPTVK